MFKGCNFFFTEEGRTLKTSRWFSSSFISGKVHTHWRQIMHHSCQSDVVQQSVITSFVRKCSNVLGKLFESGIYKIPLTSQWRTYSEASLKRHVVDVNWCSKLELRCLNCTIKNFSITVLYVGEQKVCSHTVLQVQGSFTEMSFSTARH